MSRRTTPGAHSRAQRCSPGQPLKHGRLLSEHPGRWGDGGRELAVPEVDTGAGGCPEVQLTQLGILWARGDPVGPLGQDELCWGQVAGA